MRWEQIVESRDAWYPATELLRIYPEFNQTHDLQKAVKWMSGVVLQECEVNITIESIELFRSQIIEMVETYPAYPKDRARMKKIMHDIKAGERALPVFVEAADPSNFIIEGRHRIVAFDQLGMKRVIVARLRGPQD